ncbi:MAG: hypothetical protein ACR2QH_01625 [Geminicoccaceae bacterium]
MRNIGQPLTDETAEGFRLQGVAWAQADGEARRLEKLEKIIFSEIVNRSEGSVAACEHAARATNAYKDHCAEMVSARTKANVLKAELDALTMAFEKWRTQQATRRAEMKL